MGILDKINKDAGGKQSEPPKTASVPPPTANAAPKPKAPKDHHLYSTPQSSEFSMQLASGTVKAKDGVMKVTNEQHEEIQKLISSGRPDIAQNVVHLDPEAAEKIAREALEKMRPAAHRGGAHSGANAERNTGPLPDAKLNPSMAQRVEVALLTDEERKAAALAAQENSKPLEVDEVDLSHGDDGIIDQSKM